MIKKQRILVIEDEKGLGLALKDRLKSEGYRVRVIDEGIKGEQVAREEYFNLILLDVMLPGRDGFSICQNLRKAGIDIPILVLTARNTNIDTIMGLNLGADDYLAKPFDMQVLLARIQALLRRIKNNKAGTKNTKQEYIFGDFVLNTEKKRLLHKNRILDLNAQEYRLLLFLVQNPGRIIGRDELLDEVWGYDTLTTTRTVDVHVAWLRQKLGEKDIPRFIQTVRGFGYRFNPGA